jgi:2-iminobutanoate/2-iminopropanoate deaminase
MKKEQVITDKAPKPQGKYSQAILWGNMVFLSGQIPFNMADNSIEMEDPKQMYRICFNNLREVCKSAGGDLNDIVKLNVYFIDIYYSAFLDEVIPEFFSEPYPARIRLTVKEISKGSKIEIDGIMVIKK